MKTYEEYLQEEIETLKAENKRLEETLNLINDKAQRIARAYTSGVHGHAVDIIHAVHKARQEREEE